MASIRRAPCSALSQPQKPPVIRASGRPSVRVCAAETTVACPTCTIEVQNSNGQTQSITCESGDQLRSVLMNNKAELYTTWGKIWQCGGVGQCGTCIVEVLEGAEGLSERTRTENNKLSKKPASYRLACQTLVGDGTNAVTLKIKTQPK